MCVCVCGDVCTLVVHTLYVRQYGWVFMCGNVVKANRFFWPLEPVVGIVPMPLA